MKSTPTLRDLRIRLRLLRDEAKEDMALLQCLRATRRRAGVIGELSEDLDLQLERSEAAAVITLVGATGAGKSTLLNALAGQEIAREGVDRPTTTVPTIYAPEDADVTELAAAGSTVGGEARVVRYATGAHGGDAHVFIDAPDLNSIAPEHAARVNALAQRSDVLLVVLHRQSVVEAVPAEFVDGFAARRALVFVLNRADELTDASRAALLAQIEEFAVSRWQTQDVPILAVSARRAKDAPEGEDRQALRTMLSQVLGGQGTARIRRHNVLGTVASLAQVFSVVRADVEVDLDALPAEVESGMERLAERLAATSAERWELSGAALREELLAESVRRWDGPGGWALRWGAVDVLGAGAAGLLLRRHPLLAAGTALGAAAVAGVRKAADELRVEEVNPLLPGAQEIDAAYRIGLMPARVRVGRLCAEESAFALPSQDEVAGTVATVVASAWRELMDIDLPRAAERSGLRFFRWLLDLPIYALVVWIVYRALVGFASAEYVGVDLLLNTALIAGAYLLLVRSLVRMILRRRAQRLLRAATIRCKLELDRWYEERDAELRRRVAQFRAALERLCTLDVVWRHRLAAPAASEGLALLGNSDKQARRD